MDFTAFDTKKMDEYAREAKQQWGKTEAYEEFQEKSKNWIAEKNGSVIEGLMAIFAEFGRIMSTDTAPEAEEAQAQVHALRTYITEHFYNCTPQILAGLGQMYTADGRFAENIDKAGGAGCADFAGKAIAAYCRECSK